MKRLIVLFFLLSAVISYSQTADTVTFIMNRYLKSVSCFPYPVLDQAVINSIDTSSLLNVMNFGAVGDGVHVDNSAIISAFNAANTAGTGVKFPSGKTFLLSTENDISLTKSITVWAYGATIKMKALTKYSFLQLSYPAGGAYGDTIRWLGGTLDGNQANQNYPGSPTGNNTWEEDHGSLINTFNAAFVLVKDISIVNTVLDGFTVAGSRICIMANSTGSGGAPINYTVGTNGIAAGDQGTYFKCRQTQAGAPMRMFYCLGLNCTSGSIGIHYSSPTGLDDDSSCCVMTNCNVYNAAQNSYHFEDTKGVFMYKCTGGKDSINMLYGTDIHISGATVRSSLKNCQFKNLRAGYGQLTKMKVGVIDKCQFVSEYKNPNQIDSGSLQTMVDKGQFVINSTITGKCGSYQTYIKYSRNNNLINYGAAGIHGAIIVDSCIFNTGTVPVSNPGQAAIFKNTFINTSNPPVQQSSGNESLFNSSILIRNQQGIILGKILCK